MTTKLFPGAVLLLLLLTVVPAVQASGPIGIYGVVERVVFEPSEQSPQRVRVFGAFALVDGGVNNPVGTSTPRRGFLYFSGRSKPAAGSPRRVGRFESGRGNGAGCWLRQLRLHRSFQRASNRFSQRQPSAIDSAIHSETGTRRWRAGRLVGTAGIEADGGACDLLHEFRNRQTVRTGQSRRNRESTQAGSRAIKASTFSTGCFRSFR